MSRDVKVGENCHFWEKEQTISVGTLENLGEHS